MQCQHLYVSIIVVAVAQRLKQLHFAKALQMCFIQRLIEDVGNGTWTEPKVAQKVLQEKFLREMHCVDKSSMMLPRLEFATGCSEHITHLLRRLHWLRLVKQIQFYVCVLMYHCLNDTPSYLAPSTC